MVSFTASHSKHKRWEEKKKLFIRLGHNWIIYELLCFQATAISASYSDSGLFGFQVVAPAEDAAKVSHRNVS